MLDTLLPSVGRFLSAHKFWNMTRKYHILPFGLVGDDEIGVARDHGIDLYKIRPLLFDRLDGLSSLFRSTYSNRTRAAAALWSVDEHTGGKNVRTEQSPGCHLGTPLLYLIK